MKKLLLIVSIAFGMNTSVALAQHEDMPGHDKMPGGKKMPDGDHAKHDKKKDADADKKQPPKSDDQNHKGHKQR